MSAPKIGKENGVPVNLPVDVPNEIRVLARVTNWQMVEDEKRYHLKSNFDDYDNSNVFISGDIISICMIDGTERAVYNHKSFQWSESYDGTFCEFMPKDDTQRIFLPGDNSERTFIANYPKIEYIYRLVNLTNQSQNVDILQSNQSKASRSNPTVALDFRHLLAKIQLYFPRFSIQKVTLTNQPSVYYKSYDSQDSNSYIRKTDEVDNITMLCEDEKFTAILAPFEIEKNQSLIINTGEKNLTIPLQEIFSELRPGYFYSYSIILEKYFLMARKYSFKPSISSVNAIFMSRVFR